jgi:hypothetical protein
MRIAAASLAIDQQSSVAKFADKLGQDRLAALQVPGDEDRRGSRHSASPIAQPHARVDCSGCSA